MGRRPWDRCQLARGSSGVRRALQPVERFLMSQLPPFSRPGTVRAASAAIESHDSSLPILAEKWPSSPSIAPLALGRHASGRVCMTPQSVFSCGVTARLQVWVRVRVALGPLYVELSQILGHALFIVVLDG